jgi:hypothetical protein
MSEIDGRLGKQAVVFGPAEWTDVQKREDE